MSHSKYREAAPQKQKNELLGLVKGVLADGVIVESESDYLLQWIEQNDSMRETWPAGVLYERLRVMLEDGALDLDERGALLTTLRDYVGVRLAAELARQQMPDEPAQPLGAISCVAPYDVPQPEIVHSGRNFVITGEFASSPRKRVEQAIEQLGGLVTNGVSRKTHFVLVGSLGSTEWAHGSYGTKIDKAVTLRNAGVPLFIISEQHWYERARASTS